MLSIGENNPKIFLYFGSTLDDTKDVELEEKTSPDPEEKNNDEFIWRARPPREHGKHYRSGHKSTECYSELEPHSGVRFQSQGADSASDQKRILPKMKVSPKSGRTVSFTQFSIMALVLVITPSLFSPTKFSRLASPSVASISASYVPKLAFQTDTQVATPFGKLVKLSPSPDKSYSKQPVGASQMFEFGGMKRRIGYGYFGPATGTPETAVIITGHEIPSVKENILPLEIVRIGIELTLGQIKFANYRSEKTGAFMTRQTMTPRLHKIAFSQVLIPNFESQNQPFGPARPAISEEIEVGWYQLGSRGITAPRLNNSNPPLTFARTNKDYDLPHLDTNTAQRKYFEQKLLTQSIPLIKSTVGLSEN